MHELSEPTKRLIDILSAATLAVSSAAAAVTLAQIALVVTIVAGLMSAAWTGVRFYDRFKYGRQAD